MREAELVSLALFEFELEGVLGVDEDVVGGCLSRLGHEWMW